MKKYLLLFAAAFGLFGFSQAQFSLQRVLLEEFTGTWCPYCADGSYRMDQLLNSNQSATAVAYHVGDVMEQSEGSTLDAFYGPSYPNAVINRDGALYNRGQWMGVANTMSQSASIVGISFDSIGYDPSTRTVTAIATAMFTGVGSGDYRLNMLITEDHVTGGSQYNQANSDNGTVGHPYYQAGNPIVGFDHRHVFRGATDGAWGLAGQIPTSVNFGTSVTHTFTYVIPAGYDENEIHLVAVVQEYGPNATDRKVLNSEEGVLPEVVGLEEIDGDVALMEIAPNPMDAETRVLFTLQESGNARIEVLNVAGQQVALLGEGHLNQGAHSMVWNGRNRAGSMVESGIYLVRLVTESGYSISKRVLVAH